MYEAGQSREYSASSSLLMPVKLTVRVFLFMHTEILWVGSIVTVLELSKLEDEGG